MDDATAREALPLFGNDFGDRLPGFGPAAIFKHMSGPKATARTADALVAWGRQTKHPILGTAHALHWVTHVMPRQRDIRDTYCGSATPMTTALDLPPPPPPPPAAEPQSRKRARA